LRERSLASVFWVLAANVVRAGTFFAIPVLIAWITGPVELGLAQIAYGVYAIALTFVGLGTKSAVLQHPDANATYLSSVFYVNVLSGMATGAAVALAAPWLAAIGHSDPRLILAFRWMGLVCVVSSLTLVQSALLARRLAFRALSMAELAGLAAAVLAGLAVAAAGGRFSALAAAAAAHVVVSSAAVWVAGRWRPLLRFSASEARQALRFGVTATAASFVNSLAGQFERFLLSSLFGPAALGFYGAARNVNRDALRNLMRVSDEILLPGLASLGGQKHRARGYYLQALRFEFLTFAPAAVFIAVFARDLVLLVYGPSWLPAAPLVQLLTPLVLFTITNHTIGAVFLSAGRPDVQLRWSLLSIPLVGIYVAAGAKWGLSGAVASLSALEVVGWSISHAMANKLIGLPFRQFARTFVTPLAVIAAFGAVLAGARHAAAPVSPSWPVLAAWGLAALALYAAVLHAADRRLSREYWGALVDGLRSRSAAAREPRS